MTTIAALLTNKAYGYPTRGARRRRKPTILACLHQTANATATAIGERTYANRAGSAGPSATAYIDRDGTIVRAIDPTKYAAWSQGDVASPNTRIPTVAAAGPRWPSFATPTSSGQPVEPTGRSARRRASRRRTSRRC